MTAKSKRVGKCQCNICFYGSIGNTIQITIFILLIQIDCGRNNSLVQCEKASQCFNGTRCAKHMSGHGLCRADIRFWGIIFSKCFLDSSSLNHIIHRSTRAVCIDIDSISICIACFLHSVDHCLCTAACIGMRCSDVMGITGRTIAAHLAVNLCATCFCMFIFFKNKRNSTFSDNKAASAFIKGQGCFVGIFRSGECLHVHKPRNSGRNNGSFSTAGNHSISIWLRFPLLQKSQQRCIDKTLPLRRIPACIFRKLVLRRLHYLRK